MKTKLSIVKEFCLGKQYGWIYLSYLNITIWRSKNICFQLIKKLGNYDITILFKEHKLLSANNVGMCLSKYKLCIKSDIIKNVFMVNYIICFSYDTRISE